MRSASLITPLEPASAQLPAFAPSAIEGAQSTHATPLRCIEAAVASSCGTQHAGNEDAHSALLGTDCLYVVADGVGGGAMAQTASRQLVTYLHAALGAGRVDAERVGAAMLDADRRIARRIAEVTHAPGAATVVLCAPVDPLASNWLVAWVGDCRAYRLAAARDPVWALLTRDDTFGHLGETPPPGGALDDPARMVGNGATSGANVALHEVANGDLLVLCSDGVHKHLEAADWRELLQQPAPLLRRCEALIATARARGSVDDATVLLVQRNGLALPGRHAGGPSPDAKGARR